MKLLLDKAKLIAVLAITVVLVVLGFLNLRDRLKASPVASDGVHWVDTENGVQARSISPDSPLAPAVRQGDYVRAIFYRGKYEKVVRAETISLYLDRQGIGNDARYVIEHSDPLLQSIYGIEEGQYDKDFKVIAAEKNLHRGLYLAFIGVVYLAIGLFVLFKRSQAALTYHFFAWSLVSFIVYFYSPTFEFTKLDKAISIIDSSALALLAPLFLHFCANFSSSKGLRARRAVITLLLYLPATALIVLDSIYHYRSRTFRGVSLLQLRTWLDGAEIIHFSVFFILGSALLIRTFVRADKPLLRQQLKWIVWGLALSVVPFAAFYIIPFVSRAQTAPWVEALAYGPLILIPLSFGYSIIRYRLMDVDVIMRRSVVHVMATVVVGAIYMAVLLGVVDLVKFIWADADLSSWETRIVVVLGMLIVAMLFAPIKNKLQNWADRWFYGDRYTLRAQLQEFGRTLSQTTALPRLLNSLVQRLSDMLFVDRVAIFIEDPESPSGFKLAHSRGIASNTSLPENIRNIIRVRSIGRGFIVANDIDTYGNTGALSQLASYYDSDLTETGTAQAHNADELYYFVPCVVRDRMVAIISIGRPASGALLTSEDTDLLKALSGYVAIAIDNSLLYKSETEKAEELARLKEFSENIIESVNVGILVVDFEGRITTWNSALEEILGIPRARSLNYNIEDILDSDLIATIQNITHQTGWALHSTHHLYKYSAASADGRQLTLNISLAPFEAAQGIITGAMMVIENVTERVYLEQQLLQSEKLSSIGLLAAGVAHEVNTPLTGISSYAQMLLQQVPEEDPKRALLEKIRIQTLRASGIVNNLLNFSRTGDAQFREIDLNRVLDDTLQLLEPQIRNSRMEVARNYGDNLPAAYGSASKLQQVFMNLILNARDAMPGGGKITIQTRQVDTSLVVDFRDTGAGIAPENITRIYDPFFTTKEVGQGTGLGLALSYGIIQEHGGRIFVESRLGEGTHFTIKLPSVFARHMQAASD
jgi:PAS domain S-box-containing protein